MLYGEQQAVQVGANEVKFRENCAVIYKALSGKSSGHMHQEYKQFKPMNKLPVSFENQGQLAKMKEFIQKFTMQSEKEVKSIANLKQWLETFELKQINNQAIDELVELAEIAEEKSKIALIDLFRLLILQPTQAEYILDKHWELINVCIIGYASAQDMKDASNKVAQNYQRICLQFLTNVFMTESGKQVMQDVEKGKQIMEFCSQCLTSCNQKVQYHSALLLFNYLLCYQKDNKKVF